VLCCFFSTLPHSPSARVLLTNPPQTLVNKLPTHDGAAMMLLGSLVADCASTGLEWIYDQDTLAQKVQEADGSLACLMFRDPPECPFFSYAVGKQGFYHEQVQVFRRSLVRSGVISEDDQAAAYDVFYKEYLAMERKTGADITEKYIDRLTKTFLTNLKEGKPLSECGINQFEAQSLCKVPTLVARYSGDSATLLAEVTKMVQIWQTGEGASVVTKFCTLMARLLDHVLRNRCTPSSALGHFFCLAREQAAKRGGGDEADSLTWEEIKVLQSVEVVENVLLYKIQDIEGVLALNTQASDRQKLRIQTELTRALLVSGIGDGTEAHYRGVIAEVPLEAADKDMWSKCKVLAKEAKWTPPPREKLSPAVVAKLLGISCDVHGTFFNVCYLLQTCSTYQEAVQLNVSLGGDCCSRSVVLGALFAAPIYPLPKEKELLHFCANVEQSRPFHGDSDEVSALRDSSSWIPIDWLSKCDASALSDVIADAEIFEVARSEVLLIGGGSSRFAHVLHSVLASGQPRVRVANASLREPEKLSQQVHAQTRSIFLMSGELTEDPAVELINAVKALEACHTTAHVVFLSSTAAVLADTSAEKYVSAVEEYLEASLLSFTAVRAPWMMEEVFDQTKRIREGHLSMFLPPSVQFSAVSMKDVAAAVASMLIDPSFVLNEKCLTFMGPLLCMNDVVTALSEAVGKPVQFHQVGTQQGYVEALTTKNAKSNFEVQALMEICELIEANSKKLRDGDGSTSDAAVAVSEEVASFGATYDADQHSGLLKVLQRRGRFHQIFAEEEEEKEGGGGGGGGGGHAAAGLTTVEDAMKGLPLLRSEEKRGNKHPSLCCRIIFEMYVLSLL
jgi:hypothetical protein